MKATEKAPRGTKCGLCGEKRPFISLVKTKCCSNWICNDEHKYRPFSFGLDSCYRNHDRYTNCASHYHEGHTGKWQDCAECKKYPDEDMFHFPGQKSVKKITKITKKKTNSKATGQPTTSKMSEQRSASKTSTVNKQNQSNLLATKKTNESTFESKSLSTIITRSKSVAKK